MSRTYFWISIYLLFMQILAPFLFKPADEIGVMLMLMLIALDMLVHHDFKRYRQMFVVVGIIAFYAIYSLVFHKFNTPKAIFTDFVIQLKPFMAFFAAYAIAPRYTAKERWIIKACCVAITAFLLIIFIGGFTEDIIFHIAYHGSTVLICTLTYAFCSINPKTNSISQRDTAVAMVMLAIGMLCTRSKYFGEAVMIIFMLIFYRPGMFRKIRLKQVATVVLILAAVLAVSWGKIYYYFVIGSSDTFDPDVAETFARPALIAGMFLILADFPVLGSGLASYATYASSPSVHYSAAYAEYNLNLVWGLSEQYPDFICDIFYAQFAQFGIVGIALFIYFFVWVYQRLRLCLHAESHIYFALGVLMIAFIIIESIGNTFFSQASGVYAMAFLGSIVGAYRNTTRQQRQQILLQDYK